MTENARAGSIAFRPRARLLKLIGAELISDDVVAVTELVKNAYDADASRVTISFRRVTGEGGEIIVADEGSGMDLHTVLGVWMEPGATSKSGPRPRLRRRVLGEKGVGRFAADKLGRYLELVTRRPAEKLEIRATFDWDRFEGGSDLLSDIRNRWETRAPQTIKNHGTVLRISGLRAAWTERMFRRLSTRLSRLCSPFRELDPFTICLESDEFPRYSGEVRSELLENAPYRIEALFDGDRQLDTSINGRSITSPSWNDTVRFRCGPVRMRIFAFDLENDALARIGPRLEVRAWLREWSGISVYRDGFRIWPYGEPHDDWLRLDQRRVNNPVVRLSNNQVVGFVEIARDKNPDLRDQTNREGFLHNDAFEDLKRLLHFVLVVLEEARQTIRHPVPGRSAALGRVQPGTKRNGPGSVAGLVDRVSARSLEGWSELAAAGQAAGLTSRALQPVVGDVQAQFRRLREAVNGNGTPLTLRILGHIQKLVTGLEWRLQSVVSMHPEIHARRRAIDVSVELDRVRELLRPVLEASGVDMAVSVKGTRLLRAEIRPEIFHCLICILVRNSLEWLRGRPTPRVQVTARTREDNCELMIVDNGPGIPPRIADHVFDPLFSSRDGGRGMGLAVARTVVEQHRGEIVLLRDGRRRGAAFRILLPRKRARSTVPAR